MAKSKVQIPKKPETEGGFEKPVAWLLGRQLMANLKYIALYAAFKGKLDARDWMSTRVYSFVPGTGTREPSTVDIEPINYSSHSATNDEFWFDYLADSGDGQLAVYGVAYLCMSSLWIEGPSGWEEDSPQNIRRMLDAQQVKVGFIENDSHLAKLRAAGQKVLPRGAFLFIGGDTSYHISDYATLADRFQNPFSWASLDLHKAGGWPEELDHRHPLFGIPGNHDYYDALDGFNRQFRRPATGEDVASNERSPLLALPTFMRCQEASYIALQLPHNWWFWGFDTENGDMDFRQKEFFKQLKEKTKPRKLIVATSQPTTVFGKYARPQEPLVEEFKGLELETPFLKDAPKLNESECRLDLSGDVHHYARYWGPNSSNLPGNNQSANNYASVVSGLGGAFLHPSQTDIHEVEEQALFPTKEKSRDSVAKQILNFWNLVTGGYVWLIGFLLAFIIYFGATVSPSSSQTVNCIPLFHEILKITECKQIKPTVLSPSEQIYYWGLNAAEKPPGYFLWAFALVISVFAIVGLVIYSNYMFKKIFKEQARRKETSSEAPLSLFRIATSKRFLPFWILLTVAALTLIYGMWNFAFSIPPSRITPFGCSMIVLASLVWGTCAIIQSFLYSEWLFHQAYDVTVKWYDYWPIWVLVGFALVVTGSSVWRFGRYNQAAYLLSDIIFAVMILLVLLGLIYFAVGTGGSLQSWKGKIFFALFGLWHAILQLFVPFLLVRRGSLLSFGLMLGSIFVFRFFGVKLVKQHSGWLALLWLVYGLWLLYLPFILPIDSAFLPKVTDFLVLNVPFLGFPHFSPILSCVVAGLVGLVMACVSFGWYLAVCLAFNGHNNEAGGAARIERFKGFIRLCVTPNALKVYVIGFDKPEIDGSKLRLRVIDMFQLKCRE